MTTIYQKFAKYIYNKIKLLAQKAFNEVNFTNYLSNVLERSNYILIERMKYFLNKYKKQLIKLKSKIKSNNTLNDNLSFSFALKQLRNFSQYIKEIVDDIERFLKI